MAIERESGAVRVANELDQARILTAVVFELARSAKVQVTRRSRRS